ncbi:MAG: FeoA family protein [Planctomycetia bacterium]|nr:FeoA family protein [Planctomycetia bacterium]
MTLSKISRGQRVTIVSLKLTRSLEERLAALGLFPGAEVEVVRSSRSGEAILSCMDSRIAIGSDLSKRIEVV